MNEKKSLAEEALLQMKQVEEVIAENAKGILASTMKEEINQLVKESLSEQEDDDEDSPKPDEDDMGDMPKPDMDDMDDMDDMGDMPTPDMDDMDDDTVDLTGASDEEILKVFKAMGEDDGIIIKKDGENIHLTDNDADTEYLIRMGESVRDRRSLYEDASDETIDDIIASLELEPETGSEFDPEETGMGAEEDIVYEIVMDEPKAGEADELEEMSYEGEETLNPEETSYGMGEFDPEEPIYEIEMGDKIEEMYDEMEEMYSDEMEESYHEMDEMYSDEMEESYDEMEESYDEMEESYDEMEESYDEMEEDWTNESYSHKKAKKSMKPKGVGMGSGPKFSYKKTTGGFSEKKKQGPKSVGTGKPKFEYKEGMNMGGKNKVVKKTETKEAARTLGMGSKFRKGGLPKPRTYSQANTAIKESLEIEVNMLREKNEEYRKALNVFREKLNEVAIFNSNLAYATRLFTEHSTTKKEKINILRRFDGVETLKESKNLYRSIRDELSKGENSQINESVENKINKTVSTGSSTTLIESKTYENPQFMRIKDLMGKIM